MRVIEAEHMGMCFGVRDALALARGVEEPAQVTVFGQLVHNPVVNRELVGRGFAMVEGAGSGVAERGNSLTGSGRGRVLITAHGVSDRQRAEFLQMGQELIDTTCPLVRKAHAAAVGLAREGYFVVIVGKAGHVEVRGLTGDLPRDRFVVVETALEVRPYDAAKIGVMAQTTTLERELRAVVERVHAENPAAEVRVINTVCQPTRDRQKALDDLLSRVDVLVVVGGRQSNNTRQLVGRASEAGVRAIHVEDAGELREAMFAPWERVGLTAGTSTLPETIGEVRARLASLFTYASTN